jgi:spore maturation protein CgeB
MKYLYTGSLIDSSTCEARRSGLLDMGREVISVNYEPFFKNNLLPRSIARKFNSFQTLSGIGPSIWRYNRHLLAMARQHAPDVVWIDKGHFVSRHTLRRIRRETKAFIVCYNTDDIQYARNGWRLHLPCIQEYDIYFTTNQFNVPELKALGSKRVMLTHLGYNRDLFRPRSVAADDAARLGAPVGFIGHWEPATEALFIELLRFGVKLRIRGASWRKARCSPELSNCIEEGSLGRDDYTKALISTEINLGVNSSQSRNLSSGRTFEIPAVGGFLLAQRTSEHRMFYDEGKEAEFFGSAEELAEKAGYYLVHDDERRAIALAGHRRCISSGYSWQEQMVGLVSSVEDACQ